MKLRNEPTTTTHSIEWLRRLARSVVALALQDYASDNDELRHKAAAWLFSNGKTQSRRGKAGGTFKTKGGHLVEKGETFAIVPIYKTTQEERAFWFGAAGVQPPTRKEVDAWLAKRGAQTIEEEI